MKFLQKITLNLVHPLLLFTICLYLIIVNYVPGTYLSGWDTLHPEFNFPLSFQRAIFGVFRTDQGLGAVAAHSHMSDLPRIVILAVSSLIIPNALLRYFFIGFNLIVGVLGCYFFIKLLLAEAKTKQSSVWAFLGALFYLLNLGTLQHFNVPFEMFTVQYATLPWLFLTVSYYLRQGSHKKLILFGLVTLFATPMAYAATLWYAYFLSLGLFLIPFLKTNPKRIFNVITITLLINSFWLLPHLYFLFSGNADLVPLSRMNKIFSEEAFVYNKNYGNISDTVVFKNFLFDWPVYIGNDRFDFLLSIWRNHLSNYYIAAIGYILFIFVLIGIIYSWRLKNRFLKALFLPTLSCLIVIINSTPPLAPLFEMFRESSVLFKESLRFPFTKFSIILVFFFSCYFALGQSLLLKLWDRLKPFNLFYLLLPYLYTGIITGLFFVYMWPSFTGNLVSKYVQVAIPQEYFDMFEWFNSKPDDGRVALLPIHSFWGWVYYNFGFQGAQFITFGIKQPVLDRDYDRWQPVNENYYKQMSYAIYSQDPKLISKVLEKYRIKYVIVDNNVIAPGPNLDKKVLFTEQINSSFAKMNETIRLEKSFNNIAVYEVKLTSSDKSFISHYDNIVAVDGPEGSSDVDWAYIDYGTYIDAKTIRQDKAKLDIPQISYPFKSLSDNQNILMEYLIKYTGDKLTLDLAHLPRKVALSLEDFLEHESLIPAKLYIKLTQEFVDVNFILKTISTSDDKYNLYLDYNLPLQNIDRSYTDWLVSIDENQVITLKGVYNAAPTYQGDVFLSNKQYSNLAFYNNREEVFIDQSTLEQPAQSCGYPQIGQVTGATILNDRDIKIIAKNGVSCVKLPLTQILDKYQFGYYKNLLNFNFFVSSPTSNLGHWCIFDKLLKRCIKEQKNIDNNTFISDFIVTSTDEMDQLELVLFLSPTNSEMIEEIIYKNISFYKFNPAFFLSISPDDISSLFSGKRISLDKKTSLNLYNDINDGGQRFDILKEKSPSNFCSNMLPKKFNRRINAQHSFIEYSSEEGSSCDYFSFLGLPHNVGYALIVETQNLSGLPLRICVANNHTRRCDLYLALPANKQFTKQVLLIPPANDGSSGYNIHFDNYSIGKTSSVNRLRQVRIVPFPYLWLSKIHQGSVDANQSSSLIVLKEKEFSPVAYIISYKNNGSKPGLIVLNKTYEHGWWMWGGSHVKVNGWANGWLVEPSRTGATIILYLPQLLQFSGFGILGLLVCLTIVFWRHN